MNEEEILKIMEELKESVRYKTIIPNEERNEWKREFDAIQGLLDLYYKQQKEIEKRLKEIDSLYKMMSAKDDEIEKLKEDYQILKDDIEGHRIIYVDTPEFEENYISKDKIRKEIEEIKNCRLSTCDEQINKSLKERYEIEDEICEYFEELLGE